jgi:hypothetical protein
MRELKLNIRAKFSSEKRLFAKIAHSSAKIARSREFGCLHFAGFAPGLWARFSLIDIGFSRFRE